MLDYCFLLNSICAACVCVCVHRGVTASMETRASRKDEELEDEMRTYYRGAKGGDRVRRAKCARNVSAPPEARLQMV